MVTPVVSRPVCGGAALLLGIFLFGLGVGVVPDVSSQERRDVSRLTGTVTIDSTPSGAQIVFNGEELGRTPLRIEEVNPGLYSLRVVRDGYRVREEWVRVSAGREEKIDLLLVAVQGTLTVRSRVPGMEIRLGSRWIPAGTHDLQPGNYRIPLRAPGHIPTTVAVVIRDGSETVIVPDLTPVSGTEDTLAQSDLPSDRPGSDAPTSWRPGALLLRLPAPRESGTGSLLVAAGTGGGGSPSVVATVVGGDVSLLSRLAIDVSAVAAGEPSKERPRFGVGGGLLAGPLHAARTISIGLQLRGASGLPGEEDALSAGIPVILGPYGPGFTAGIVPAVETAVSDPAGTVPYPAATVAVGIRRRIVEVLGGGYASVSAERAESVRWKGTLAGRVYPPTANITLTGAVETNSDGEWWAFFGSEIAF
jgi:hypothetical protein